MEDYVSIWRTLTSNYYLNVAVISWFVAQITKGILNIVATKKVNIERFVGNGGMPSSHSAFTVSLAVAMLRKDGFASPQFAMAFVFASVVLTDAMGVRRAAGEQAKILNKLLFEFDELPFFNLNKNKPIEVPLEIEVNEETDESDSVQEDNKESELKEYLGHTPLEVVGGTLLGIIIALIVPVK